MEQTGTFSEQFMNNKEYKQVHVIDKDSYETGISKLNVLIFIFKWLKVCESIFSSELIKACGNLFELKKIEFLFLYRDFCCNSLSKKSVPG